MKSVLDNDERGIELIVVDQSDVALTRDACAPFFRDPRFRYVHTRLKGLSRAYNLGIRLSTSSIVAFTDDDCVAHSDWISETVRVFEENPDADMIYGQTIAPDSSVDDDTVIPELLFAEPRRIGRGHGLAIIGMGANFAIRRSLVARVGPFDEALGGGGPLRSSQDFDFQYRAYRAGAIVRLSPEPKVDHYGARRQGEQWRTTLEAYGVGDGAFYWKHVRCGDVTAMRLFAQRVSKTALRQLLIPVRRRPSHGPYLKALAIGVRDSMRFGIDRSTRLYKLGEGVPR